MSSHTTLQNQLFLSERNLKYYEDHINPSKFVFRWMKFRFGLEYGIAEYILECVNVFECTHSAHHISRNRRIKISNNIPITKRMIRNHTENAGMLMLSASILNVINICIVQCEFQGGYFILSSWPPHYPRLSIKI